MIQYSCCSSSIAVVAYNVVPHFFPRDSQTQHGVLNLLPFDFFYFITFILQPTSGSKHDEEETYFVHIFFCYYIRSMPYQDNGFI